MFGNRSNVLNNKPICDDKIFAQLTDMFGDSVPAKIILRTGQETNWQLEQCIEKLIKFDPSSAECPRSMQSVNRNNNIADDDEDDDADVLIESEEIQPGNQDEQMAATVDENQELPQCNQSTPMVQPSTSFSAFLKHHSSATSSNNHQYSGSPQIKQRRLMPASIEKHPDVPDIIKEIEQNFRILICMRGAPGSGKSFLAQSIIDTTMSGDHANHIFSTDDFFYDRRSRRYNYDRSKLGQAHESNHMRCAQRAMNGWSPIIIDNTNMKLWEMFPYFREAVRNNYIIRILEPNTPWRISVGKLEQRNKHGVDREAIARMLTNYEPGTVQDVLHAMKIENYRMIPQLRCFPEITNHPNVENAEQNSQHNRFMPKDQRQRKNENNNRESSQFNYSTKPAEATNTVTEDWPAFEQEQSTFWTTNAAAKPNSNLPKPQRKPAGNHNVAHMYSLLQEGSNSKIADEAQNKENVQSTLPATTSTLQKHQKNCPNENRSFQQIRQIFSSIPIALLWDLFEKCKGDANWATDLLLNENELNDFKKFTTQEEIDRDNFVCSCASTSSTTAPMDANMKNALSTLPTEWSRDNNRSQVLPARTQRRPRFERSPTENEVRKQIEEQFVISDEYYSSNVRKVRDVRRSQQLPSQSNVTLTIEDNQPTTSSGIVRASGEEEPENGAEDDEMVEMDLGIELVCQLDAQFGTNAIQANAIKDIKTKVFMPKSLCQQLYAIWVESLYNQIEEQRLKSIKEDEEFAKEFQTKQSFPQLFEDSVQQPGKTNVKNIADMEYVWKAYNAQPNEWKQTTPEDLATKLTKAKLFEIFPNVKRETLIEVFTAHGNKFAKTVDFFKDSLENDIGEQVKMESQHLLNQARVEAQAIKPVQPTTSKVNMNKLQNNVKMDKLDIEEAKRAALKDFEESRNMAMHHSHLKAECYIKAKEAFQRRQPQVAYYYSNVANLHNNKIDMYNNRAANAIVEVHSYTQKDPDMLDLHYLHAGEAIECLDIYLDRHIKELKDAVRGFKYVFIITGRGLHSTGGFSTIKHRVKCRLRERNLSWAEVNPGLLKVKLQYISIFAQEAKKQ